MSKTNRFKYFLGFVLFIALSVGFVKSTFDVWKSKERLDEVNKELAELEAKKAEIEKEIEYKQTLEYIEERARNDLNLIKPGEKVYVVVGQEGLRQDPNVLSDSDVRKENEKKEKNWYSWYRLFFSP